MSLFELYDGNGNKHRNRHGVVLPFKINCDALIGRDWACIAALIAMRTAPFGRVEGVPTGGNALAEALTKYLNPASQRILLVDDVLTTGQSMALLKDKVEREIHGMFDLPPGAILPNIDGFVIFDRSQDPLPEWIKALFYMRRA
jgi:hypothetical protein